MKKDAKATVSKKSKKTDGGKKVDDKKSTASKKSKKVDEEINDAEFAADMEQPSADPVENAAEEKLIADPPEESVVDDNLKEGIEMQSIEGTVQNDAYDYDDDEEKANTERNAAQDENDLEMEL